MEPISLLLVVLGALGISQHASAPPSPTPLRGHEVVHAGWWRISNTNPAQPGQAVAPGVSYMICLGQGHWDNVRLLLPRATQSSACTENANYLEGNNVLLWRVRCGGPTPVIADGRFEVTSLTVKGEAKIFSPPHQSTVTQIVNAAYAAPCDPSQAADPKDAFGRSN